jgi:hypothetical protein
MIYGVIGTRMLIAAAWLFLGVVLRTIWESYQLNKYVAAKEAGDEVYLEAHKHRSKGYLFYAVVIIGVLIIFWLLPPYDIF